MTIFTTDEAEGTYIESHGEKRIETFNNLRASLPYLTTKCYLQPRYPKYPEQSVYREQFEVLFTFILLNSLASISFSKDMNGPPSLTVTVFVELKPSRKSKGLLLTIHPSLLHTVLQFPEEEAGQHVQVALATLGVVEGSNHRMAHKANSLQSPICGAQPRLGLSPLERRVRSKTPNCVQSKISRTSPLGADAAASSDVVKSCFFRHALRVPPSSRPLHQPLFLQKQLAIAIPDRSGYSV